MLSYSLHASLQIVLKFVRSLPAGNLDGMNFEVKEIQRTIKNNASLV